MNRRREHDDIRTVDEQFGTQENRKKNTHTNKDLSRTVQLIQQEDKKLDTRRNYAKTTTQDQRKLIRINRRNKIFTKKRKNSGKLTNSAQNQRKQIRESSDSRGETIATTQ